MMKIAEALQFDPKKLVIAFQEIEARISEKQREDLQLLYETKNGFPYKQNANGVLFGPTIQTCKSVGSRLKAHLGDGPKYGMSWIGGINKSDNWAMHENVREAFRQLGWFGSIKDIKPIDGALSPVKNESEVIAEHGTPDNSPPPLGCRYPVKRTGEATDYERDEEVRNWVLRQSNGSCECCKQQAPFESSDGIPYLEVHHIRHLANGGSDRISNAVALCPNCHRELHFGKRNSELIQNLYESINRLIPE